MKQAKKKQGIDMLHGSIWNKLPLFALPVAATAILEQLFNASDIAVVGNFTGGEKTVAVAAVGANSPIIGLIVNLFIGIALGANVVIANAIGRNDENGASRAVHTSIIVSVIGGLAVALIGELAAAPNVPSDVFDLALLYLRIYLLGMPVILLYNFEAAVFRSVGDTKTPLITLAVSGVLTAVICISDPLRKEAKDAIKALHALGVKNVVMMTGDNEKTAAAVAREVGVDEYHAEVLPEDKAKFIREEKTAGRTVIMIGDGVNDTPALSEADVGIAINTGAAIAKEIADITISSEDLFEIVKLRELASALTKRIDRNYRFIVGFNFMLIVLGVAGFIQPTTSAMLHNMSTLGISLKSMTNLLPESREEGFVNEAKELEKEAENLDFAL